MRKMMLVFGVAVAFSIAGCSTTTDRERTIQNLDHNDGQAVVIYQESEVTTTRDLFSTDRTGETKDQRYATCEEENGTLNCQSLPIMIDGEPLSTTETESNNPF